VNSKTYPKSQNMYLEISCSRHRSTYFRPYFNTFHSVDIRSVWEWNPSQLRWILEAENSVHQSRDFNILMIQRILVTYLWAADFHRRMWWGNVAEVCLSRGLDDAYPVATSSRWGLRVAYLSSLQHDCDVEEIIFFLRGSAVQLCTWASIYYLPPPPPTP
jgi:hypothetical protein